MKKIKKGNVFIIIGLLLIAAALLLTIKNISDSVAADNTSKKALEVLKEKTEMAENESINNKTADSKPLYVDNKYMDMPNITIDGNRYVGELQIPSLGIDLPVRGDFSYSALRGAPCRYKGSVYTDDIVIAAHNYSSHFGNLKRIRMGSDATFTDSDGNVFNYVVSDIQQIDGKDIDAMLEGDWDMTLFTCTLNGKSRVTVRLERQ